MSAIFGFVGIGNNETAANHFRQMSANLSHRGVKLFSELSANYALGFWSDGSESFNPILGAGISTFEKGAIGLSGFQTPSADGRVLTLDEIDEDLAKRPNYPDRLSGDFVAAVVSQDGELSLIRDGAGSRTIYYAEHGSRCYFASEPKAISLLSGFSRTLNTDSLVKYLAYSFIPLEPTMLRGIFELPAGHILQRDSKGLLTTKRFFKFEDEQPFEETSDQDLAGRFRAVFAKSVSDRLNLLRSQQPAVFLSGGLDSSIVAAELAKQSDKPIRSYSLHFGRQYPNELEFAKSVATRLGTEHNEVLIEPKSFLQNLRMMIWHLDDPIGDPITMPNFELAKIVGKDATFVFNGEGGDPCFGGPKNIPMMLNHWYGTDRTPYFRELAYLASYRRAYEEIDKIFTPDFARQIDVDCLRQPLTPLFECERPVRLLDKLAAINVRLKGAHLILPKVERMLAAAGMSPLSPLFSPEIVKFSFQIPSTMKLRNGIEKVILKNAYQNDLPTEVIARPKSGMRVPVHFWFQGELRKYARHILSSRSIKRAGIFDHKRVKQLLDYNIEEGNGRYGIRLWMLLTFEIWRRIFIEGEAV